MNPLFSNYKPETLKRLVTEYPLAWVFSVAQPETLPARLPLVGKYDTNGKLTRLIGHMARSNPQHQALLNDPKATILFNGPDGYISPEHAGILDWGPTWNYANVVITAEINQNSNLTEYALKTLIEPCEGHRNQPWNTSELGDRYGDMLDAIIGFEATVLSYKAIFKLGQDERPEVFATILASHPDTELVSWMLQANSDLRQSE